MSKSGKNPANLAKSSLAFSAALAGGKIPLLRQVSEKQPGNYMAFAAGKFRSFPYLRPSASNAKTIRLTPPFATQMQALLGPEWPAFAEALTQPAPVSIRANPAKWPGPQTHDGHVPWHPQGYYLPERPVFILDPLWHTGAYYVQEASSMAVAEALKQAIDMERPLLALDLAAAPGGKSTLLASLLCDGSLLIANEVIRSRYQALKENLIRWGRPNAALSNHDPQDFAPLAGRFDLVLVDAPCSGEGLFRKDPGAEREWSPQQVQFCAARQRRILADAAPLLAPGGVLLYSTCTYNDEENTFNAQWLRDTAGLEYLPLHFPGAWGIAERPLGYQFYPHRVRGEGFYMACFRKPGREGAATPTSKPPPPPGRFRQASAKTAALCAPWLSDPGALRCVEDDRGALYAIPTAAEGLFRAAASALRRFEPVLELGEIKQGALIPAHALALSTALSGDVPSVALDLEQALLFLRKEDPQLAGAPRGWLLASYEGHALGWMKGLGNRVNNYLPKSWRILGRTFREE